jgi:RNA polymerase sigma-70 factor (ECF subfamily)
MRRILVERARARARLKRGGGGAPVSLEDAEAPGNAPPIDVLALDEALTKLAKDDPRKARLVELRYFAGLSLEETAVLLERSVSTVKADWDFARAWLRREMSR